MNRIPAKYWELIAFFAFLLILAVAYALLGAWVVLHIPQLRQAMLVPFSPITEPIKQVCDLINR